MTAKLRWIAALAAAIFPGAANADFNFNNLTAGDYDAIVKELSATSIHSTVTPASSLGGLWGFELGLVAATSKAPETKALVARASASTSFNSLYNAGALARLGLPYGITAEAVFIPKIKIGNGHLKRIGLGAQWTLTDSLLEDLPVNIAVKGYYTKTSLDYAQTIQNSSTANLPVAATITLDDAMYGLQSLLSYKIFLFEPYVGLGWTKAKGKLEIAAALATATIFNIPGVTSGTESSPSSAVYTAGIDFRAAFFTLGAEYDRAFDKDTMMARLSFRF